MGINERTTSHFGYSCGCMHFCYQACKYLNRINVNCSTELCLKGTNRDQTAFSKAPYTAPCYVCKILQVHRPSCIGLANSCAFQHPFLCTDLIQMFHMLNENRVVPLESSKTSPAHWEMSQGGRWSITLLLVHGPLLDTAPLPHS